MTCDVKYETLAAFAAGDLDAERTKAIENHLADCERCRRRVRSLEAVDRLLVGMVPQKPSSRAILETRRALPVKHPGARTPDIMTLDDVADYLHLSPEALDEIVEDLPAFELAGHVRVRRERLVEWIEQRERDYARQAAADWTRRVLVSQSEKGVA